jgi:membrane-bound inhibitor of C-type lysozyme
MMGAVTGNVKALGLASILAALLLLTTACGRIIDDPATPEATPTSTPAPATGLRALPQETPVQPPVSTATADPATLPTLTGYLCDGGRTFSAWVFPRPSERVVLVINDVTYELRQQPAASGISYSNQTLTFRAQGATASIEDSGQVTFANCRAQ